MRKAAEEANSTKKKTNQKTKTKNPKLVDILNKMDSCTKLMERNVF